MLLVLALACGTQSEPMRGVIRFGPGADAQPAPDVTVSVYDIDLELYDKAVTGPDGAFEVTGPRGQSVYAEISGQGLVNAGFVGNLGQGPFDVPDGTLFAWEIDRMNALRARYEGCAVADGGVIHGEIRLFGATGDEGDSPTLRTGFARLVDDDGEVTEACYLDEPGTSWDPDAIITGEAGEYALFGVEPGLHTIEYGYFVGETPILHYLNVWVPEDGIAPQFPAWVDLVAG